LPAALAGALDHAQILDNVPVARGDGLQRLHVEVEDRKGGSRGSSGSERGGRQAA
jgi:hypothetical protein